MLLQCIVGPRGLNFHSPVWGESISSTLCPLRGEEFPVESLLVPGSGYHQHLGLLDPDNSQNTCIEINEDETLAE